MDKETFIELKSIRDQLSGLLSDDDLTDEKLREASESLIPRVHDRLVRLLEPVVTGPKFESVRAYLVVDYNGVMKLQKTFPNLKYLEVAYEIVVNVPVRPVVRNAVEIQSASVEPFPRGGDAGACRAQHHAGRRVMSHGMKDLQETLKQWHHRKYTHAPLERIGLKLGEEAGEVQRCIDRIIHAKTPAEEQPWLENLVDEIGDVTIVLIILCARGGLDFEDVVRARAEEVMAR